MKLILSYLIFVSLRAFFFKRKWDKCHKVANVIVWLHYLFVLYLVGSLICMGLGLWPDSK